MPSASSFKENIRSSTPGTTWSTVSAMNDGDVFGSSHQLNQRAEELLKTSKRSAVVLNTNETNLASRPLVNSMRSNTQSPVSNQTSKRKRTMTGASIRDSSNVVQNHQGGIQHTPNPRLRKQVRQAVMSPEHGHSEIAEVSLGSSPRGDGGPSRRHVQDDVPTTPTRKGQSRGRSVELALRSPHATNPNADYIPPSRLAASPRGVSVRRRSITPIPPYEPPKEQYTPPREVVVSPPPGERKPVRRAVPKKKRVSVKTEKPPVQLWVKTEPPEVDLTTPAPPASPGDDPILLVGPPSIRVQRASLPPGDSREVSLVDFEMDITLPEDGVCSTLRNGNEVETPARSSSVIPAAFDFSRLDDEDGGLASNNQSDASSEVDYGTLMDNGGFESIYDDGGVDSDSDNEKVDEGESIGEGDFTGKFSEFKAPLKLDPPENGDDRMEKWARPISPHPKRLSLVGPKEEDLDVGLDGSNGQASRQTDADNSIASIDSSVIICEPETEVQVDPRPGYADRRGRRLTLSEVEAIKFGPNSSSPVSAEAAENGTVHESREEGVANNSFGRRSDSQIHRDSLQPHINQSRTILDNSSVLDKNSAHAFDSTRIANNAYGQEHSPTDEENDEFSARSASEHSSGESSQTTLNNADIAGPVFHSENGQDVHLLKYGKDATEDELMNRSASLLREPFPPNHQHSDCETEVAAEEDQEGDSEEGAGDLSVVKIVSDDPMAAARAAAILKMHDYDMVARRLRRRKTTSGGISKAYSSPKNLQTWRRRTVAGLTAEDALSANISLPELLEKAEEELRRTPARSRSGSVALSSIGSPQKSGWNGLLYEDADEPGIREWTKADWKLLDSCFTDERYDLAEQLGLELGRLADVDDVPLESVVERFIKLMGGAEMVASHGPSWSTEKLMARTKALCKRQRSGNGAPPTPDVSARFSTPSRFSTLSPTSPSMILPDFTPAFAGRTRLFDSGSVSRKAMLPPSSSESFFRTPSALPARHSRLRQDVTSDVLETPRPSRALDLFGFATPSRNLQYQQQQREDDSDDESIALEVDAMLTPITASRIRQSRPESAVKRSLNYISSWLKPDMFKPVKDERKGSQLPGLPVPPEDLLSKSRGPVETPAPRAAPKTVPHKELVSLDHVPPPQPTKIPRPQKPRRLVDLNHVPTPQPKEEAKKKTLSRRSSVKDLIKEFEDKEKGKAPALAPPRVAELRRQGSINLLKGKEKPTWKP